MYAEQSAVPGANVACQNYHGPGTCYVSCNRCQSGIGTASRHYSDVDPCATCSSVSASSLVEAVVLTLVLHTLLLPGAVTLVRFVF